MAGTLSALGAKYVTGEKSPLAADKTTEETGILDSDSVETEFAILNANNVIRTAVSNATQITSDPELYWNKIPEEQKTLDRVSALLRNPSNEFLLFLQATAENGYTIDYLGSKGIINTQLYRDFINVENALNRKIPVIENTIRNLRTAIQGLSTNNNQFSITQQRLDSRLEQQVAAQVLRHQFDEQNQNPTNLNNNPDTVAPTESIDIHAQYLEQLTSEAIRIQENRLPDRPVNSRYTNMTQAAVNSALAYTIMMLESFPQDGFDPKVMIYLNRILMNSGYSPNQRVADDNNHLTMGFNQTSYNTFRNYVTRSHAQNPLALQFNMTPEVLNANIQTSSQIALSNNSRISSEHLRTPSMFVAMVNSPTVSANLFYGLTFHNLNSFENFLRNLDGEDKVNALSFMRNADNIHAFLAIAMHFNEKGSTPNEHSFIINLLKESNFASNAFLNLIKTRSPYVRKAFNYFEHIITLPEFSNLNCSWGYNRD